MLKVYGLENNAYTEKVSEIDHTETTILGIIFWIFAAFQKSYNSLQVKQYLLSGIKTVHELPR